MRWMGRRDDRVLSASRKCPANKCTVESNGRRGGVDYPDGASRMKGVSATSWSEDQNPFQNIIRQANHERKDLALPLVLSLSKDLIAGGTGIRDGFQ